MGTLQQRWIELIGYPIGGIVGGALSGWDLFSMFFAGVLGGTVARSMVGAWRWRTRSRGGGFSLLGGLDGRDSQWIGEQLRRAGVAGPRAGGGGTLLTEPVLISLHRGSSSSRSEIYDQGGLLLATGSGFTGDGQSRLRRWLGLAPVEFRNAQEETVARVTQDRSWNATQFRVTADDGKPCGWVSLSDGSVRSATRVTVGHVKRPGRRGRLLGLSRRFDLQDADGAVIGHVTRTQASPPCFVIELDEQATVLRPAVLAIAAAVNYWLRPHRSAG